MRSRRAALGLQAGQGAGAGPAALAGRGPVACPSGALTFGPTGHRGGTGKMGRNRPQGKESGSLQGLVRPAVEGPWPSPVPGRPARRAGVTHPAWPAGTCGPLGRRRARPAGSTRGISEPDKGRRCCVAGRIHSSPRRGRRWVFSATPFSPFPAILQERPVPAAQSSSPAHFRRGPRRCLWGREQSGDFPQDTLLVRKEHPRRIHQLMGVDTINKYERRIPGRRLL